MRSPAKRVQGSSSAGRRWSSSGKLEELEWRLLMTASTGTYPAYILDPSQAVTPLEQAQAAAIRDVQGPTLAGNAGPLAKIGSDLAEVYEEHRLFTGSTGSGSGSDTTSGGSGTGTGGSTSSVAFKPSNSELQVQGNDVVINAIPVGSMPALESTLVGMGMQITGVAGDEVSGLFPLQNLPSLAALSSLNFARAAYAPVVNAGLLDSQGDQALKAQTARSQFNVDGTGIKVGIISDSFNTSGNGSMNTDIATGDLPAAGVQILADGNGEDEGRGMAQIVHDIAPGAAIAFSAGGDSQASMAQSVNNLQSVAHSQVIVDDLGFLDEPFFQDSVISQAVDNVVAKGVTYFSAAGNEGDNSYQSAWVSSGTAGPAGGQLLNFATSGSAVSQQPVTIASGATVNFSFQFSQPFASVGGKAATSQVNIYLLDNTGTIVASGNSTTVGGDALQLLNYQNGTNNESFSIEIELASGPAPSLVKYIVFGAEGSFSIDNFNNTTISSSFGHANSAGAIGVGAVPYYQTPFFGQPSPLLELFSSPGGIPILYDSAGNLLATPIVRQDPAISATDGVNTTFFGSTGVTLPDNFGQYNFFGTSAAAPHAAAVAALMLQAAGGPGSLTPTQVRTIMENTALPISGRVDGFNPGSPVTPIAGPTGVNNYAGYGLIDAYADVQDSLPTPPTAVPDSLTLAENTFASVNVLANDTPGTNDINPATVVITTLPAHGTVSVSSTGVVTYTPNVNYFGPDSFDYDLSDVKGLVSNSAAVAITVTFVDLAPIAELDVAQTNVGAPVTVDVLANDYAQQAPLSFIIPATLTIVTQPLNGTATIVNNKIVYTPKPGYIGGDSLSYTVADNYGTISDPADVLICMGPEVALSGSVYVDNNLNNTLDASDTPVPGVPIELLKTDGNFTFAISGVTAADGTYSFAQGGNYIMPQGTYTIRELQPAYFVPGANTVGTSGAAGPNDSSSFAGISMTAGQSATGYDFGQQGATAAFVAAFMNRRAFLASTGPDFTVNPSAGTNYISFDSGIQGTLNVTAQFNPAQGSVAMSLLNSALQPVATSTSVGGVATLSFSAQSSQPYFLAVNGTNHQVQLVALAPNYHQQQTTPVQGAWHNAVLACDVNGDGVVTPLDAVDVLNALNGGHSGVVASMAMIGTQALDVNNDGSLTPIDALQVLDYLNSAHPVTVATTPVVATGSVTPAVAAAADTSVAAAFALAVDQALAVPAVSPADVASTSVTFDPAGLTGSSGNQGTYLAASAAVSNKNSTQATGPASTSNGLALADDQLWQYGI